MQRDMFLSTLINDRAHPMVALPAGVIVVTADMTCGEGFRVYRSGDLTALDLPTLCQRMIKAGTKATHLQVYDATCGQRVPMAFMSISETATWRGQVASEPAAIPAAGQGAV